MEADSSRFGFGEQGLHGRSTRDPGSLGHAIEYSVNAGRSMSVPRQALELTSVEKDVDRLGRHGCRRGHGARGHALLSHDGREIAAGHAVVVAVDGAAVGVGEVGRNDLDSIALREVWLDCGQKRNHRGHEVRSGHGRSQPDGLVARNIERISKRLPKLTLQRGSPITGSSSMDSLQLQGYSFS